MEPHEKLAMESQISRGVLGNGTDFVLLPLDKDYSSEHPDIESALKLGLFYCGAIGWKTASCLLLLSPTLTR